jgi:hypothetical protein
MRNVSFTPPKDSVRTMAQQRRYFTKIGRGKVMLERISEIKGIGLLHDANGKSHACRKATVSGLLTASLDFESQP